MQIVCNGYIYTKRRVIQGGEKSYWKCIKKSCCANGILHNNGQFLPSFDFHNHDQDFTAIVEKRNKAKLKAMMMVSNEPFEALFAKARITKDKEMYKKYYYNMKKKLTYQKKKYNNCAAVRLQAGSDFEILPSYKNHIFIVKDGFVYRHNGEHTGMHYWRCHVNNCKARGKTRNNEFEMTQCIHSHPAQMKLLADPVQKSALQEAALDMTRPLVEIFAEFDILDDVLTKRYLQHLRDKACAYDESQVASSSTAEHVQNTSSPVVLLNADMIDDYFEITKTE